MTNFMRIRVSINTVGNKPQRKKLGVQRKKKKKKAKRTMGDMSERKSKLLA